jgi:hypothetical protein
MAAAPITQGTGLPQYYPGYFSPVNGEAPTTVPNGGVPMQGAYEPWAGATAQYGGPPPEQPSPTPAAGGADVGGLGAALPGATPPPAPSGPEQTPSLMGISAAIDGGQPNGPQPQPFGGATGDLLRPLSMRAFPSESLVLGRKAY